MPETSPKDAETPGSKPSSGAPAGARNASGFSEAVQVLFSEKYQPSTKGGDGQGGRSPSLSAPESVGAAGGYPGLTERCSIGVPSGAGEGGEGGKAAYDAAGGVNAGPGPGDTHLAVRVWQHRLPSDRGGDPTWFAELWDRDDVERSAVGRLVWTGARYHTEGDAVASAECERARRRGVWLDDVPDPRADLDPVEAALALTRGTVGYRELRDRICRAVIKTIRAEERVWQEIADTGGLDAATLAACREMRDAGWVALIGAIGGAL
jgi:hypothetical protein